MKRTLRNLPVVVVTLAAIAIGAFGGRLIVDRIPRYGFEGISGAGLLVFGLVAIGMIAALLVGGAFGVAGGIARRRGGPAHTSGRRVAVLALGSMVAGTLLGAAITVVAGDLLSSDRVLQTTGQSHSTIRGDGITDITMADGPIECHSVAGLQAVGVIVANDLGRLRGATVVGHITFVPGGLGSVRIDISVEGPPFDRASPPRWSGTVTRPSSIEDGSTGAISFENLTYVPDAKAPTATRPLELPTSMSGTIRWTCNPW